MDEETKEETKEETLTFATKDDMFNFLNELNDRITGLETVETTEEPADEPSEETEESTEEVTQEEIDEIDEFLKQD